MYRRQSVNVPRNTVCINKWLAGRCVAMVLQAGRRREEEGRETRPPLARVVLEREN